MTEAEIEAEKARIRLIPVSQQTNEEWLFMYEHTKEIGAK